MKVSFSSMVGDEGKYRGESEVESRVTVGVVGRDMWMVVCMVKAKVIQKMGKDEGFLYIGSSSRSGFVIFLK